MCDLFFRISSFCGHAPMPQAACFSKGSTMSSGMHVACREPFCSLFGAQTKAMRISAAPRRCPRAWRSSSTVSRLCLFFRPRQPPGLEGKKRERKKRKKKKKKKKERERKIQDRDSCSVGRRSKRHVSPLTGQRPCTTARLPMSKSTLPRGCLSTGATRWDGRPSCWRAARRRQRSANCSLRKRT